MEKASSRLKILYKNLILYILDLYFNMPFTIFHLSFLQDNKIQDERKYSIQNNQLGQMLSQIGFHAYAYDIFS